MRTFFQRNALMLILAALFAVVAVSYAAGSVSRSAETAAQESEIADLEARMKTALAAAEAEQQEAVDSAQGTSEARLLEDTALIREFMRSVATWDSGESYTSARETAVRRYGLAEDSQFLQAYFPEPVFNTDTSGNRFYVVDTEGLKSSLESIDVQTLAVTGTEYRYMVLADISSESSSGKSSANRTSVIYLTLDGEGTISDVSGFASVSGPLSSK